MFEKFISRLRRSFIWGRNVGIRWGRLMSVQVVVFEIDNLDYLLPLCGKASVMPVDASGRTLYLSWEILFYFVKAYLRGVSMRAAYYAALIRAVSPAIVITYVDNSDLFYQVAHAGRRCARFLAIQNAARYDVLELPKKEAHRIFLPEFACFGEYERDLYLRKEARVETFYPIGSLRESYFRRYRKSEGGGAGKERYDHDLCVVAEASPGWDRQYPGFEDAVGRIAQYAVRLAREQGLRMVIAGKRDVAPTLQRAAVHSQDAEVLWYERYIGNEIPVTPRVRDQFTTYGLISRSRLSLAMVSTALREGMSRGDRVLFCNFSGNPLWDYCVDGIWTLKEDTYAAFSERVLRILALSDEEYAAQTREMSRYVMNNDDGRPTYTVLANLIADAVAGRQ